MDFCAEVFNRKPYKMANMQQLAEQISLLASQLQASEEKRQQLETRIDAMNQPMEQPQSLERDGANTFDLFEIDNPECNEPDIEPELESGNDILLESFKAIPEFSGRLHEYRSWRNQVARRMRIIDPFKKHPKYEAALAIIRAKITGAAADVLTNNKTPYNIICILKTLDATYTDQRPLYAIEAQMVAIKQNEKSLHQFYNAINFALNAIILKVVQTYKNEGEQRSLVNEAQKKAIRTFIVGLKFRMMRHILYGRQPQTLSEAFSIAQTVFHDNEYLQFEHCTTVARGQPQQHNIKDWNQQRMNNSNPPRNNMNSNQPKYNAPEPIDVDASHRMRQAPNWRQPQQPQKMQRINHIMDAEIPEDPNLNDDANDSDDSTNTSASAFLDE